MTPRLKSLTAAGTLSLTICGPVPAAWASTQQPPPAPAPTAAPAAPAPSSPSSSVPVTEAEFRRIKEALGTDQSFSVTDDQLRFYVKVLAKQPTFAEWVKGYDLMNGPTRRGNPMSHQEFLTMVTPKELHSSGGITATEMLSAAVTNWLGQTLLKRAFEELRVAKDEREAQEIRDRINRELAALRGE